MKIGIDKIIINKNILIDKNNYKFNINLIKGSKNKLTIWFYSSELWYKLIDNIQNNYNIEIYDDYYNIPIITDFKFMKYYFNVNKNFYGYYVIFEN